MHPGRQGHQGGAGVGPGAGPPPGAIGLLAVNVGRPRPLARRRGAAVRSAIAKQPVTAAALQLGWLNLEGDEQADLTVHGGPDKAVYAYPSEHLAWWSAELGPEPDQELGPAAFGENLSTVGATEDEVCVGDRWRWGEALLEVSQPRSPCFKLALHRGVADIGPRFSASGRTGWYLRVLEPGSVPVAGPVEVVARHPLGATVAGVHAAHHDRDTPLEVLLALLELAPLAASWRVGFARRLQEATA